MPPATAPAKVPQAAAELVRATSPLVSSTVAARVMPVPRPRPQPKKGSRRPSGRRMGADGARGWVLGWVPPAAGGDGGGFGLADGQVVVGERGGEARVIDSARSRSCLFGINNMSTRIHLCLGRTASTLISLFRAVQLSHFLWMSTSSKIRRS